MKEKKKKHFGRGGAVLLKKYGPDYFKKLAEKKIKKQRKMKALWDKTHPPKKKKK